MSGVARQFSILDAIGDRRLFGSAFKDMSTWQAWLVFLAGLFALPMSEADAEVWRACTGRAGLPDQPFREAWLVCGRRSGKSFVMALVAVFLACFRDYGAFLAVGEKATIMIIAADKKQARVVLRFVRGLLSAPVLAARVVSDTVESIELEGDVVLEVITASNAVRGYTVGACLCDELAFWPADEASTSGAEVIAAIRPTMLTVPNSLLICASSPYARRGPLWDSYRKYFGKDDAPVLVWQAPTLTMNPSVPQREIDAAYEADPASAAAEFGAEFRTDVESFVSREIVEACVAVGVHERPPMADIFYSAFTDPSGGSSDAMTLAVAHKEGDAVIIDALRARQPPFSPDGVVSEFAALLKSYRVSKVSGDRYAGEWPRERFKAHDIDYEPAEKPKSDLYRDLLPLLNAKRIDLLDDQKLQTQLVGLERRTARSGKDSIDHAPNGHDDTVNAVAGAADLLATGSGYLHDMSWVGGPAEGEKPPMFDALPYFYRLQGGLR
jgi:Terminase large subunit, T4likevirus-type, N-terminal